MWILEDRAHDMPIRNEDWKSIHRAIDDAIAEAVKPAHGWKKAVRLLRELGPIATIIGVFVAMLAITLGAIYQSFSHVMAETEFRTNTKNKLDSISAELVALRFLISSNQPLKDASQKAAKQLLAEARQKLIPPIPTSVIEQAGKSFIEAAKTDARAWNIALEFVQYRSILNKSDLSRYHWLKVDKPPKLELEGFRGNQLYVTDVTVPCAQGAVQVRLGFPTSGQCSEYMLFVGGQVPDLDGNHFKNTTFQNVRISYQGGPLVLENVSFIDCTFDLAQPTPSALRLASAILGSATVTLTP